MFERFTAEAWRVVVLAREEAGRLRCDYVGSEHILLGLLGEPSALAFRVLAGFGMSLEGGRAEVAAISRPEVGPGEKRLDGRIRITRRAMKVLEFALREALALEHDYVGPEHILLGVIREGDGAGASIVHEHADLMAVRTAVLGLMPAGTEDTRALRWMRVRAGMDPGDRAAIVRGLRVTPAADATLAEAARLAGAAPAGTHHLLLAALADSGTAAARALAALGVDLDQARDMLRGVDFTGTGDEPPDQAGRRELASHVSDDLAALKAAGLTVDEATQATPRLNGAP